MQSLVRRARKRLFQNHLIEEGVKTACAALAACLLLLTLGLDILDWRWTAPLPIAAGAAGLYRALTRRPSLYRAAQIVDHRLGLADTLSTAFHFRNAPAGGVPETLSGLAAHAERAATAADVRKAVPYTMPRNAYVLAALVLAVCGLFTLRYAVSRRLDLHAPMARLLGWNLRSGARTVEAREDRSRRSHEPEGAERENLGSGTERAPGADAVAPEQADARPAGGDSKPLAEPEEAAAGDGRSGQISAEESSEGREDATRRGSRQQAAASRGDSGESGGSLMDKFKDAFQNLLSRVVPRQGVQASAPQPKSDPGSGKRSGAQQTPGNEGSQGGETQDRAADEAGSTGGASPEGLGPPMGKTDEPPGGQAHGSGIGSEDGSKEIRQAAQLAAMGKISEIVGKRAADLSGEATVEVQSSPQQQLRTPYQDSGADHGQGGASIGRDEVPLVLQPYVTRYFEQVRKKK